MNYPVKTNQVAFIKYSDEPVFVTEIKEISDGVLQAAVRRAITGENGTKYEKDFFLYQELVSEKDRVINNLELTKFASIQRNKYANDFDRESRTSDAVADATGLPN